MFRFRQFTAPLSAAGVSFVIDNTTKCEGIKRNDQEISKKVRILVVGSGLTGCLTALRIRQRLKDCKVNQHQKIIDLHVAERATYPAGRFGAMAKHQTSIADIGAQVLSTLNPNDYRAMGGHGVTVKDIKIADEIVQDLLTDGLLEVTPEKYLGETSERMIWEGLWRHYTAPMGMSSILWSLLNKANVVPRFGVRIDEIFEEADSVQVNGISRQDNAFEQLSDQYDCVVLCIPAGDVLATGAAKYLSKQSRHVLENVGYDQRTCEAHFFSADLRPFLEKVMGEKYELTVDNDKIEYISLQNPKRRSAAVHDLLQQPCALVVHGQTGLLEPLDKALNSTLSNLTGLSELDIESFRLDKKSIRWEVSQMTTPMEAVVSDPPPNWQCLCGGGGGKIIIAGDFMTQSSFLGCVATADAAARAVIKIFELEHYVKI